jgi:hypothetical protein
LPRSKAKRPPNNKQRNGGNRNCNNAERLQLGRRKKRRRSELRLQRLLQAEALVAHPEAEFAEA